MPYLALTTNIAVDEASIIAPLSVLVAEQLGKSEAYVMVVLEPQRPMVFAGTDAPTAHVVLKSLGLQPDQTPALSEAICDFLQARLGIACDRVYIDFQSPARKMFGWNSKTFG